MALVPPHSIYSSYFIQFIPPVNKFFHSLDNNNHKKNNTANNELLDKN